MTDKDYGSELDDLFAEMELKSQLAPDAYARKVAIDEAKAKLSALLRRAEVEGRKDELEQHAAVTKGVLDPDKCMKLLAARHIKRLKELEAEL